jgi:hypothetical protein
MSDFYFYGRRVATIFQALPSLGKFEDDMSRSVGWTLSRCPALMSAFLKKYAATNVEAEATVVRFQVIDATTGRTDLEIESGDELHVIIEAKRSWELPSVSQLRQYATRLSGAVAKRKMILVLTDCSRSYVDAHLSTRSLLSIPIVPVSWGELAQLLSDHRSDCTVNQRFLVDELLNYLRKIITMQQIDSNWVFVVALNEGTPAGWGISWADIVAQELRYFHPVGTNVWPPDPPNYIAFRYRGELQSIHHIESHEVVTDLHEAFPQIPSGEIDEPHYLYRLGAAFRPDRRVPTGANIKWAARRWCMLDTLFTSQTISEAHGFSKQRELAAPEFGPR